MIQKQCNPMDLSYHFASKQAQKPRIRNDGFPTEMKLSMGHEEGD